MFVQANTQQRKLKFFEISIQNIIKKKLMEYKGKRNSRKIKTAVFQHRRIEEYNSEVCKSINILPIKIQGKFHFTESLLHHNNNAQSGKIQSTKNVSNHSSKGKKQSISKTRNTLTNMNFPFGFNKNTLRLNSKNQNVVPYQDQIKQNFNPKQKLDRRNSNTSILHCEDNKLFQKLHQNKQIMMFDQSRLIIQANRFKTLLNDFQSQLKQANIDRQIMNQKLQKYEHYFKQMQLKNLPSQQNLLQKQSNHQLKILNLQKKVQTLNFIIKQYRQNNKQEIKVFQQKLKDFKPNIEFELTEKLAQSNQKYFVLLKKVEFFQKQCKDSLGKADWHELMNQFSEIKIQNQKNFETITQLNEKIKSLTDQITSSDIQIRQSKKLKDDNLTQKQTIQKLTDQKFCLQEQINKKQQKFDQLNHKYQQNMYKLEGMKNLCQRIENKQKTIKRNTVMINRLQCENIQLKTKMQTVVCQFQARVFCQNTLKQNLKQMNQTVSDVIKRIYESLTQAESHDIQNLQQITHHSNSLSKNQKQSFLHHLFQKLKESFNQIIKQYQNQLKLTTNECQQWKNTFDCLTKYEKYRNEIVNEISQQMQTIEAKRLRCTQSMNKSSIQCLQCQKITAYWGQLSTIYDQDLQAIEGSIKSGKLTVTVSFKTMNSTHEINDWTFLVSAQFQF